jgi:hypothetical protein
MEGLAASDNPFVCVDGEDEWPDLAIGRLPVTEPEEVAAIVAKTVRYVAGGAPVSPEVLLLHDGSPHLATAGGMLTADLAERGLAGVQLEPLLGAGAVAGNRDRVLAAFARQPLLVHFSGHGGRYIWRTAPADLDGGQDLFDLDDLDLLPAVERPPIVLSMTCYSAPFDHPLADSIGEKLLRLDGRGAVAVIAASWRNNPSPVLSQQLLAELGRPGATVGEALARTKQGSENEYFVQQYNLLGDPALPVPAPTGPPPPLPSPLAGSGLSVPEPPITDIVRGAGTSDLPSRYRFVDDDIESGRAYYYYVESVSIAGERERFTPVIRAPAKAAPGGVGPEASAP